MSYSFSVRAATREEAVFAVIAELDKVVAQHPVHAIDRKPALDAVVVFLDVLQSDPTKDIAVSVSGWLSWPAGSVPAGSVPDSSVITAGSVNVGVSLVEKLKP